MSGERTLNNGAGPWLSNNVNTKITWHSLFWPFYFYTSSQISRVVCSPDVSTDWSDAYRLADTPNTHTKGRAFFRLQYSYDRSNFYTAAHRVCQRLVVFVSPPWPRICIFLALHFSPLHFSPFSSVASPLTTPTVVFFVIDLRMAGCLGAMGG